MKRNYLKTAAIINIVLGMLTRYFHYLSLFYFVTGVILFYLSCSKDETLANAKTIIFIIGLLLLPVNLISSVIIISSISSLNIKNSNGPPVIIKKVMDPEIKKIDTLLKLGVSMILLSGILFATTTWNIISSSGKVIALLCFSAIFILISIITEKKFKLYKSSYMYWIVSMSFLIFGFVSIFYFKMISIDLSYFGIKKDLAYFITFFVISGLSLATYLKYSKDYLLYTFFSTTLLSLSSIMHFMIPDQVIITTIISIIILAFIIIKSNQKLYNYCISISFLTSIYTAMIIPKSTSIIYLLLSGIIILTQILLTKKEKDQPIIRLIIIYLLGIISITNLQLTVSSLYFIMFILFSILTITIKYKVIIEDDKYCQINYILYLALSFFAIAMTYQKEPIICFLINLTLLIEHFLLPQIIEDTHNMQYSMNIQPLCIFSSILTLSNVIRELSSYNIIIQQVLAITSIIYCIIHFFNKDKSKYEFYLILSVGINLFFLMIQQDITSIVLIALSIIYLLRDGFINNIERKKIISFIYLLVYLYTLLFSYKICSTDIIINSGIFLWLLIIFIIFIKDKNIDRLNYLAIVVPLLNITSEISDYQDYFYIMLSIIILYLTFIIITFFINNQKDKELTAVIGIILSVLFIITTASYIIGLYIGILGLIVILIGFYKKEYKQLFTTGIVITIINIIIQLKEVWEIIPFWLYLLVGGLSIITFVTYKQINKK